MKNFMDFMKHNYDHYYVVDENGVHSEVTREICFAPTYDRRQRWYWDEENRTFAVRLPLTNEGKAVGNVNLAAQKKTNEIKLLSCSVWALVQSNVG